MKEIRTVKTKKGYGISATFYYPENEVKAAVLIVSAMSVNQHYYSNIASWLADKGYLVASFDYFGMGESLSGRLKDVDVTVLDWAENDCVAMLEILSSEVQDKPIYWVGHSLGGQLLGLVSNSERLTKAITIAAGSGYWRENAPQLKRRAWILWYFAAPVATRLLGYFPGKRLNMVGDLPRGVIMQWRKWCLHPEYMVGAEGKSVRALFAAIQVPITSLSFTDDELMSEENINSLHSFYTSSSKKMLRISPDDIAENRIGHFGFFKQRYKCSLWQTYLLPELNL